MKVIFLSSINDINSQAWDDLIDGDYPFISHAFLALLENSGSVTKETGWIPFHLTLYDTADNLVAVMPLYIKTHSWGEYVFDQSWANAYQQHNLPYYPKFVTAIPFTPATGPRIIVKKGTSETTAITAILEAVKQKAADLNISSWHLLFTENQLSQQLKSLHISQRYDVQFHWFNRGYNSFEDFLQQLTSRKRKNIKKERLQVADQGISHRVLNCHDITAEDWQLFYRFYHMTYLKRSGRAGYLTQSFFVELGDLLPEKIILVIAYQSESPIAAALYFRNSDTLFGRYWGCLEEYEFLHFESCYYQGIEYCIQHNIARFDAGAQGEHKIQRGFEPIKTWSNHWLKQPEFAAAIEDFLDQEADYLERYIDSCRQHLPFKKNQ